MSIYCKSLRARTEQSEIEDMSIKQKRMSVEVEDKGNVFRQLYEQTEEQQVEYLILH